MKSVLKICNMKTMQDVNVVRNAISNNEGVIACEINAVKGETQIIFDNYFVTVDDIIQSIEDLGYTVL
ncbi:heavy-metal-associated domain-containing protein [Clostridium frigidicarnis]|uniref:Copper chaperone CopZ n=1 Tax=Clostridium frigidicarnis TaxID=84698 RepID=A0A1I1AC55_9CLOT|nr:heavy-metal-associated domain-containing protein [Clostridium frigidicarnis]SFB34956.1 Copper chaperone CopZ [Clostridium frigidicarnis]